MMEGSNCYHYNQPIRRVRWFVDNGIVTTPLSNSFSIVGDGGDGRRAEARRAGRWQGTGSTCPIRNGSYVLIEDDLARNTKDVLDVTIHHSFHLPLDFDFVLVASFAKVLLLEHQ